MDRLENIKIIRERKNITLQDLSERTGLSSGYLSDLERGIKDNPTLNALERIAQVLEVRLMDLYSDEEAT